MDKLRLHHSQLLHDQRLGSLEQLSQENVFLASQFLGSSETHANVEFSLQFIVETQIFRLVFHKVEQVLHSLVSLNLHHQISTLGHPYLEHYARIVLPQTTEPLSSLLFDCFGRTDLRHGLDLLSGFWFVLRLVDLLFWLIGRLRP